jgi:hypothetical protein
MVGPVTAIATVGATGITGLVARQGPPGPMSRGPGGFRLQVSGSGAEDRSPRFATTRRARLRRGGPQCRRILDLGMVVPPLVIGTTAIDALDCLFEGLVLIHEIDPDAGKARERPRERKAALVGAGKRSPKCWAWRFRLMPARPSSIPPRARRVRLRRRHQPQRLRSSLSAIFVWRFPGPVISIGPADPRDKH